MFLVCVLAGIVQGCPTTRKRITLTNHGWGNDLLQAQSQVRAAWKKNQFPYIHSNTDGWHYARSNACRIQSYLCYFKHVPCQGTATTRVFVPKPYVASRVDRRVAKLDIEQPCAVLHVRRSDVLLNRGWGNASKAPLFRYVPVQEYIDRGRSTLKNLNITTVFVATDSSDVIDEIAQRRNAWAYTWITRPRFKSTEGGWENHFPSQDPFKEVLHILTIRQVTKMCVLWLGTRSSFARYMTQRPFNGKLLLVNNRNTKP